MQPYACHVRVCVIGIWDVQIMMRDPPSRIFVPCR